MSAGARGRFDRPLVDLMALFRCVEPRDIFLNGAGEQRHVLGQIADELAEAVGFPINGPGTIDPDRAGIRHQGAGDHSQKRRFAGAAGTNNGHHLARFDVEADVGQNSGFEVRPTMICSTSTRPAGAGSWVKAVDAGLRRRRSSTF